MRPVLGLLLLLAACGSSSTPGTDGGAVDLAGAGGGGDLAEAPRGMVGTICGAQLCAAQALACCSDTQGSSGECRPSSQCLTASFFTCDGPEDCPPAEPVCCAQDGISTCRIASSCGPTPAGYHMCHRNADCTSGVCCKRNTSPYGLCLGSCN